MCDKPGKDMPQSNLDTDVVLQKGYKNSLFQLIYQEDEENSAKYFVDLIERLGMSRTRLAHDRLQKCVIHNSLLSMTHHDVAYWHGNELLIMAEHQKI